MPSTEALPPSGTNENDRARAAKSSALVVVEAERGVLSVSGSERVAWLNAVVTADAASVTPERAGFGLLLSKQGKIQTDFYLLADGERLLLVTAPATAETVRAELDRMLVMEDVELLDESGPLAALSLHGPRAFELARDEAARASGVAALLDRTGLGGAVLVVPRQSVGEVTGRLEAAGARLSLPGDWPAVRVPQGVGIFGVDYGPSDNPHEASLERRAIAWDKGCYLGQEAVFMQDARGKVKRRLVVLALQGSGEVLAGAAIERPSGEAVGRVTSSASVPEGERYALGMVAAPDFEPGTVLAIGGSPARVIARAFEASAEPPAHPNAQQTV